MRIISEKPLREFWERHPDSEGPLAEWLRVARRESWRTPQDLREQFSRASFVGSNRVVFNIKGNQYRLVAAINYPYGIIYIRFVGAHSEYGRIDVETV